MVSMSRVGNCYDNAAKESFFGHFKEEFYIFYNPQSQKELEESIGEFVEYYNNKRLQVKLQGTPNQYRAKRRYELFSAARAAENN